MSMGKITRSKTYNELRHREIGNRPPRGRPPRRGVIDIEVIPPNERRQERPLPEIRLPMPPEPRLNEPRLNEPRVNIPQRTTPPREVPTASRPKEVNAGNVSNSVSSNQNQTNNVSSQPPTINATSNTSNTVTFPGQLNASQLQQKMAAIYTPQIASIINNAASSVGVNSEVNSENVFNPHFNNKNVPTHTPSYINPPMNTSMSNGNVIHPHPQIAPNHVPNYHNNPIMGTYNHSPMVQNYPIIPINSGSDSTGVFPHHSSSSSNSNFMNIPSHGVNVLDANHQAGSAIVRTPSTATINSNGTIPSPIDSVNGPPISFVPPAHNSDNASVNNYANRVNPPSSATPESARQRPKYYRLPDLDSLDTVYDVWNEWNVGLNDNPSVIALLEVYGNKWATENKDPLIARKKIIKEIQIRTNDSEIDKVINDMERMRDGHSLTWLAKKFGKKRTPTHHDD
ncbi:3697_t:CDS:2 [Acaulospora morrowiae]|uniref:3697_t:CDS:1 n=1 Tax=Acaulospora morrowiae TaxID=94023 RepID=A0A9N9E1L8_9GLOM|nr:3697_t:CDS:2 [Acaulospora morrowiae]